MKQHITKEQIIEDIGEEGYYNLVKKGFYSVEGIDIGSLIEFLGDDLQVLLHDYPNKSWYLTGGAEDDTFQVGKHELIDALWEAVKYKLRNTTT